tara:strand:+ start:452 stop:775 length:324 start_codon:yes stop_codon:yes gene_type:complete
MTGIKELRKHIEPIERLLNLVTIDAIITDQTYVEDDVDPLKKIIHFRLGTPIREDIHSRLRKMIKSSLWTNETSCGKVVFTSNTLSVSVYLKRIRPPAWTPPKIPEE